MIPVAVKIIRKDKGFTRENEKELIQNELNIMRKVGDHPNLIGLIAWNLNGRELLNEKIIDISYLVIEYCTNGTLYSSITKKGKLHPEICRFYFSQLIHVVKYLHEVYVTHCDIKPSNLYLDQYFNLKLGDMGCALQFKDYSSTNYRCFGTRTYMAPEVVKANKDQTYSPFAADIYAIGATLHYMLTGKNLISVGSHLSTVHDSCEENFPIMKDLYKPSYSDDMAHDLLQKLITPEPEKRIVMNDIMNHPWLQAPFSSDIGYQVYSYMYDRHNSSTENQESTV